MDGYLDRFVQNVWPKITEFVSEYGGQTYDGYLGPENGWGWHGPFVWSEDGDLKRVITKLCEDEFGFLNVHNESKVSQMAFEEYSGKSKSIDIDVTNAQSVTSRQEFRKLRHGLFVEVKMFQKGSSGSGEAVAKYLMDCEKLHEEVKAGRCHEAIAIVVDEGDQYGTSYITKWEEQTKQRLEVEVKKYAPVVSLCWRIGD